MTVARPGKQAVLEQLVADGVRYMFGNPGTVEQGLLDELETTADIEYVLPLQEAVAVGIADGYARATASPTLVQLHSGVGLGNGIGMLSQAKRGHAPLVVVAGEAGIAYDAMDAQMACDLVAMAQPVTKYATRVVHPASVLRVLRRAIKIAMTPPRGPGFAPRPMDVLEEPTSEPVIPTTIPSRRVVPVPEDLQRAVNALAGARSPVILVGDGVTVSGAQAELARVARLLDAPVWGVDSGEVNLPASDPHYAGQLGHMFGEASAQRVAGADVVPIVGTDVFPEVFPLLTSPFRADATVLHIDLDDYEIGKNYPVDVGLVADPRPTLAALADGLAVRRERREDAAAAPERASAGQVPEPGPDAPLMDLFVAELARQAPRPPLVFDEALTASPTLTRYLPPVEPGGYFSTRGGSLGVGIPGAIGLKLAHPDREVVGFTGDGGSMYTAPALWTAARHGVAARFVICNNGRYRLL